MRFLVFVTGYPVEDSRHHSFAETLAFEMRVPWFRLQGSGDLWAFVGLDDVVVVSADFLLKDPGPDLSIFVLTPPMVLENRAGYGRYDVDPRDWAAVTRSFRHVFVDRSLVGGSVGRRDPVLRSMLRAASEAVDRKLALLE